jgi:hypothetical protein
LVALVLAVGLLSSGSNWAPLTPSPRFIYSLLEGAYDSLWEAAAGSLPGRRLAEVPHREGYGVRARVSPDGRSVAFNVWPAGASPELWVLTLATGETRRLAAGIDLPSPPLWSPGGSRVLVRTSSPDMPKETFRALSVDAATGEVSIAVPDVVADGVYLIGWIDGGLAYAVIDGGTDVYRDAERVAHLSDGIARDFSLSADGALAFREVIGSALVPRVVMLGGLAERALPDPSLRSRTGARGSVYGSADPGTLLAGINGYTEFAGWLP